MTATADRSLKVLLRSAKWAPNLALLAIIPWSSLLTFDPWLPLLGLVLEVAYLIGVSKALMYQSFRDRIERAAALSWGHCLLLWVTFSGIVVILFFGFGKHLLSHPLPHLTHAEGWEVGALIWTALFLFYYFFQFGTTGKPALDKLIALVLVALPGFSLWQAWRSLHDPLHHVIWVLSASVCFALTDLILSRYGQDSLQRERSNATFWWADVPMSTAFAVLWAYLAFHPEAEDPEVFVSGIVSCQLLISNVLFIVMEFGVLRLSAPQGPLSASQEAAL